MSINPDKVMLKVAPDVGVPGGGTEEPTVAGAGRQRGRAGAADLRLLDYDVGMSELNRIEKETRPSQTEFGSFSAKKQEQKIGADGQWVDVAGPNQDSVVIDKQSGLVGVADGVGGAAEGDKASKAACNALQKILARAAEAPFVMPAQKDRKFSERFELLLNFVKKDLGISPARFASEKDLQDALKEGFIFANQEVSDNAPKGATTLSAGVIYAAPDGRQRFLFANRGDSRIYRYRGGALEQLTRDDSLALFLKEKKLINDPDDEREQLSSVALNYLRDLDNLMGTHFGNALTVDDLRHVIMSALGKGEEVDKLAVSATDVEEGDIIVTVSDGVCDNLTRAQLEEGIERKYSDGSARIAEEFVRESKAVAHSASPRAKEDDMSAAAVKIRAGVSLDEVFQKHLAAFYNELQSMTDQQKLQALLIDLYTKRNQAEMAITKHPENSALAMLRDHILERLRVLDQRVMDLKQSVDTDENTAFAAAG